MILWFDIIDNKQPGELFWARSLPVGYGSPYELASISWTHELRVNVRSDASLTARNGDDSEVASDRRKGATVTTTIRSLRR
jgi:hypothetical protein